MVGSTLGVYSVALIFVSARTNKRHHHHRHGAIHEAKKRRATQVITCSFPCGKWLHMIGARSSPRCELCRREREDKTRARSDGTPPGRNTDAHIQSAGCKAQRKSVIGAHNRCGKYLLWMGHHQTWGGKTRFQIHWTKTNSDSLSHCGGKRIPETSYHGRVLRMKRERLLAISKGG
jgi:hypothetical protein